MTDNKHTYVPVATFQQVLDYTPGVVETYTSSPIVNALAKTLHQTLLIESQEVAEYLAVDARKLAGAIQLDLGMRLIDVIQQFRLHQIQQYRKSHPDEPLDKVAHACGYASDSSLWRFFQRKLGTTATGKKSNAGPERFNEMCKEIRKRHRYC